MGLTDTCIRRPVLAWMIMVAVLVFGAISWWRIGVSEYPDVDIPYVTVQIAWPGAAPELVEHDVVEPVEEALAQVQGLKSMSSTSHYGSASIVLEMEISRSADLAVQDIQNRLGQIQRLLPSDAETPVVVKANFEDFPILWISLSGPFSRQELADVARYRVKPRLQTVPGVGEIQWGGYLERNVRIWLDRARLDERNITAGEALAALRREHIELPAGRIETATREMDLRVLGEAKTLDELRRIPIGGSGERPIRLGDVALVEDGFEDVRTFGRNSGSPAQALGVKKQYGTNAVAVAEAAKLEIERIRPSLPKGMVLEVNFDGSRFIGQSVREVQFELMLAVLLTSGVCWLFLGSLRAAFNVVLAIPMSMLGTVAVCYFLGYTFNTFTLLAMALAVGVVVDDAIMVQENISRHIEAGMTPLRAASRGTHEIRFAALAATVAIIAIVLPVVFMPGLVGKFFLQFGVALSVAVALSYLEAVTLAPARCAQFMAMGGSQRGWLGRRADRAFAAMSRSYRRILPATLRHPWRTIGGAVVVFILSIVVAATALRAEFYPKADRSGLFLRLETQAGSSLAETDVLTKRCEDWLLGRPEVSHFFTIVGGFGGTGVNTAVMFVTLTDPDQRQLSQHQLGDEVRKAFNAFPGMKAEVQDNPGPGGGNYAIEYSVRGNDWDGVVDASKRLMTAMREAKDTPGLTARMKARLGLAPLPEPKPLFVDVDSNFVLGRPEVDLTPDRDRCHDIGVPVATVAEAVNSLVGGVKVGKFDIGTRRIDLRARLLLKDRLTPDDLRTYRVRAAGGALVPLSELVRLSERAVLQQISRKDHNRAITVHANLAPGIALNQGMERMGELAATDAPGLVVAAEGMAQQMGDLMLATLIAFVLGLLFGYMVLAAQFDSILHPLTVYAILPLALAGAFFSLAIAGQSINTFSLIGLILLMGLVKKNSIILVDYAERGRRAGLTAGWAVMRAGVVRLRPILMTSAATAVAAVPVAFGFGAGTELRRPMAVAVLGGVVLSTLLSLVVVPACYVILERMRRRSPPR